MASATYASPDASAMDFDLQEIVLYLCIGRIDEALLCLKRNVQTDSPEDETSTITIEQPMPSSDPLMLACMALTLKLSNDNLKGSADYLLRRALGLSADLRNCLGCLAFSPRPDLESQRLEPRVRQFMVATLGLWLRRDVLRWVHPIIPDELSKSKATGIATLATECDDNSYMLTDRGLADDASQAPLTEGVDETQQSQWLYSLQLYIVYIIAAISLMALVAFMVMSVRTSDRRRWWQSQPLGGQFTLAQAKGIDFIAGALLAPSILAALGFLWFSSARSSISINQGTKMKGVPLRALVEASSTSTGSYNLFKFKNFMSSGRPPFMTLGILTLVVAFAQSFVSNIIAYEAYDHQRQNSTFNLTSLSDDAIHRTMSFPQGTTAIGLKDYDPYLFDSNQTASFADRVTGLLTAMSVRNNAGSQQTSPSYVGINATSDSLAFDSSVRQLHNVGAYRLTMQCNALQPSQLAIQQLGTYSTQISPRFSDSNVLYQSFYPGRISSLQTATNDYYAYTAFDFSSKNVFLGYLASFNMSTERFNSSYGAVTPRAMNMTLSGFNGTKVIMSSWGLNCTILRQTGLVNLTRSELNLEWTVDTSFFDSKKQQVRNLMSDWQVALGWSAPGASSPGIAPAMAFNLETPEGASSTDLDYFARNFLEASAALEKTVYEVAAGNSTRAKNATVQGTMKIQLYRITFIPAIAFASILTICIAASLTAGLAWYSEISLRTPRGRIIDGLRLTSDLLLAFQGQQYDLPKSHSDSDTVEKRGKGFRVYYKPWTEGTQASIRLDQV